VTEDVISASLLALAGALSPVLEERGQGARRIEAVFFRADGHTRRIAIVMGKPVRDPALIIRLFRERLAALADPLENGFGFDLIRLQVSRTGPMTHEPVGLQGHSAHAQDHEIDGLIDCLSMRLGPDRVLRFCPQDTHIPEAAGLAVRAQSSDPAPASWHPLADEMPRRPLRLFEAPEPIEVMAEVPDGPPVRFRWRRMLHSITRAEGPERIAMEWWHADGFTRDYFRVEDEAGQRFWLYRDGLYALETNRPDWYVHGLFA